MTTACPNCSQPADGRFCASCGTALETKLSCSSCGAEIPPGGRFCTECGASVGVAASAASATNHPSPAPLRSSTLPWIVAAAALVALLAFIFYPRPQTADEALREASGPPITGTSAAGAPVDLSSMSPREAADRLFNRVMMSVSEGDTAQAMQFLPMALAAYDRVESLDRDGRYHVAVLHLVNEDPASARAQADTILAEVPNHLFGLGTAAQAERAMGNEQASRDLYARFLEHFAVESTSDLPEYREHEAVLPALREEAEAAVGR